jgi:hypothetical protein
MIEKSKFIKCNEVLKDIDVSINKELKKQVKVRCNSLFKIFEHQLTNYFIENNRNPGKAEDIADKLILTFGVDFWEILAVDEMVPKV